MTKKLRKCGYARVSTKAEEQEHSLLFQTHYYKTLIESEKDSVFIGIYADTRSGKTARLRKQFNEMIKAARRGEIDYIVTKSIARFARNLVETLRIIRELREIGVGIFFEKEQIDTLKSSSDFITSIHSLVAEGELTTMSENVKWAARKRYAKGSVELNSNLYGYTLQDGLLIPVPAEAAIVKEAFERYASGDGLEKIARSFNERGVAKKTCDRLWRSTDIARVLDNEKHVGDALLQKKIKKDFKLIPNDGTVPQYYVENDHEPIVSRELFEAVQALRASRREKNKTSPTRLSPFAGKITCAECGKGYKHRKNNRGTAYEKWIWSCSTYVHAGRKYCGGHSIREADFKSLFLAAYNEAADFQPHEVKNLDEAIKDLLAQERELIALKVKGYIRRDDYDEQHAELLRQIHETEEELAKGTRSIDTHLRADEYSDRLAAALEGATVDGFEITFTFKNGAKIKRKFNNDTNRKETWARKLGGLA